MLWSEPRSISYYLACWDVFRVHEVSTDPGVLEVAEVSGIPPNHIIAVEKFETCKRDLSPGFRVLLLEVRFRGSHFNLAIKPHCSQDCRTHHNPPELPRFGDSLFI